MSHRIVRGLAGVCLVLAGLGASVAVAGTAGASPVGKPAAPTGLTGNSHIIQGTVLSWNAVTDNTSPVTEYQLAGKWGKGKHPQCKVAAPSTTCTLTGLSDGRIYKFKIRAINAIGKGPYSPQVSVEIGVPNPPTGVTATAHVNSASVAWTAPTGTQVSNYTVTASPGGQTCTIPTSPCTVTGLAPGTAYTFTVVANTSWASSAPSAPSASITTPNVPGVPTGVTVSADTNPNPSAEVNFTAPDSDGGSDISGYTVVVDDTTADTVTDYSAPASAATNGYLVSPLNATDSYTFSVYATNAVGNGAASTPVAADPAGPTSVNVTDDTGGVATVSWTPSDVTLGTSVNDYYIDSFDLTDFTVGPSDTVSSSSTSDTISGFTNAGDEYDVCVSAQSSQPSSEETCVYYTPGS